MSKTIGSAAKRNAKPRPQSNDADPHEENIPGDRTDVFDGRVDDIYSSPLAAGNPPGCARIALWFCAIAVPPAAKWNHSPLSRLRAFQRALQSGAGSVTW